LILPTRFWNAIEILNAGQESTFGTMANENCTTPSMNSNNTCFDPHFVCLSKDLASMAANALNQTPSVQSTVSPIDQLYRNLQEQQMSSNNTTKIHTVAMNGIAVCLLLVMVSRRGPTMSKSLSSFRIPKKSGASEVGTTLPPFKASHESWLASFPPFVLLKKNDDRP